MTDEEQKIVLEILGESPQSPKTVLNEIPKRLEGKTISGTTLRRIARSANLRWKRMRRSLKSRRDEHEFRLAQDEIRELVDLHEQGEFDLYFFDEAGFSLVPDGPLRVATDRRTFGDSLAAQPATECVGVLWFVPEALRVHGGGKCG